MSEKFEFINLKDSSWFERQKIAGRTVARCLSLAHEMIINQNNLTLKEIEAACLDLMTKNDCTPTFLNYKNSFPGAICASVNKQLVHGIPSNYQLQEGDVVKIDLGCTYKGAIGDAAITVIKGTPRSKDHVELLKATKECLEMGLGSIKIGNRIGAIGNAIYRHSRNYKFGLITQYGGHGIGWNRPHEQPFVANKALVSEGIHIQNGLSLAVEPMLVIGSTETFVKSDGWTVCGMGISAHFEHTVFIYDDKIHLMTVDED